MERKAGKQVLNGVVSEQHCLCMFLRSSLSFLQMTGVENPRECVFQGGAVHKQ